MVKKKVTKTTVTETINDSGSKKKKTRKTSNAKSTTKTKKKPAKKKPAAKKKPVKRKASTKKKTTKKKTTKRRSTGNASIKKLEAVVEKAFTKQEKRDHLIAENFVGLQKAMATLSVRFSELSQNMNGLLKTFEDAAKILAESEKQVDKTLTTKLDTLVEQNKSLSQEISTLDNKMKRSATKPAAPSMYSRQIQSSQPVAPVTQGKGLPPKQLPQP